MNRYPAAVIFVLGNDVDIFPVMVEASSRQEAHGLTHDIGSKIQSQHFPEHNLFVKVGNPCVTTIENAELIKETKNAHS